MTDLRLTEIKIMLREAQHNLFPEFKELMDEIERLKEVMECEKRIARHRFIHAMEEYTHLQIEHLTLKDAYKALEEKCRR